MFYEHPGAARLREGREKVGKGGGELHEDKKTKKTKKQCLCVRGWQTMIRLEDVSGTAGSERQPRLFSRRGWGGGAGINRHGQHIPKLDKLSQIKSCLQEGIWGIMVQWQFIYLWPHYALAEVIATLCPRGGGGGRWRENVRDCECVRKRPFATRIPA